jgi:hypothetical protein
MSRYHSRPVRTLVRPLVVSASVALALCAMDSAELAAQTPAPTVLYGCYVPGSGTVYRIKSAGAPSQCASTRHVEFTWNEEGAQGPQGPAGPPGPEGPAGASTTYTTEVRRISHSIRGGTTSSLTVYCLTGSKLLSGGYDLGSTSASAFMRVMASHPLTDAAGQLYDAWKVEARNENPDETVFTPFWLTILCSRPAPTS